MSNPSGIDGPIIGCLGGGQLARMLALSARAMGVGFRVWDPNPDACARTVAEHVCAPYDDLAALDRFTDGLEAATYEFENVPAALASAVAQRVPLRPGALALGVCQDRVREKEFFAQAGLDVPAYRSVSSLRELERAIGEIGAPCVLKTRSGGYDGKGQAVIRDANQARDAWASIEGVPAVLEAFVPFERELSLVCVRGSDGSADAYPLCANTHTGGILSRTIAPAPSVAPEVREWAHEHARSLLAALEYVGVLTIEFFEAGGRLLANECAPRVHNSGHWTIEGASTSQFEQHIRAVLGWPLGDTSMRGHAGMLNLVGGLPEPASVLRVGGSSLHRYGKLVRPGRKVGHITAVAATPGERDEALSQLAPSACFEA